MVFKKLAHLSESIKANGDVKFFTIPSELRVFISHKIADTLFIGGSGTASLYIWPGQFSLTKPS
jgi:hypothetical protein